MDGQRLAFGPFVLDVARGTLARDGRPVAVGQKGLLLLGALLRAPGRALGKAELMDAAWPGLAVEESNLSVQIAALRKLLGPAPDGGEWIATVPRIGYRFVAPVVAAEDAGGGAGPAPTRSPRPSIAVMPFRNVSGSRAQDYLADGITEDIITALTRFRWFRVAARSSSFAYKGRALESGDVARELGVRYLLEGSVRRSGRRVRVSAQLVDAGTAGHIWAERYDLDLTEAFAVQDAIAERVAGAIEPELLKAESLPAVGSHTGNVTAWDLVRQGTWLFHQIGRDTHARARELFRRACRVDPELAEAHVWLARVDAGIVAYGWSDRPAEDVREGLDAALRAVRLDERNPYAHYALAIASAYAGAPEQAVLAAERAVAISPSFALGHLVLGMAHLFRGCAPEAVAPLEHGLALNGHDPQNFVWFNLLALARYFAGAPAPALDAALEAAKVRPGWRTTLETLVVCHAALGRLDEARRYAEALHALGSGTIDVLTPMRTRNPHWAEHVRRVLHANAPAGPANAGTVPHPTA